MAQSMQETIKQRDQTIHHLKIIVADKDKEIQKANTPDVPSIQEQEELQKVR